MHKETFNRILNAGWTNFKRNSYVSFGTTGVMALVLLLFLGLITLNFMAANVVDSLQKKVDVSVYFKVEATDQEVAQVKADLESQPTVTTVEYVSRDQALADFKARHAGDALIQQSLAELDTNPLQASLNIKAKDSAQYASIVQFLEAHKLRSLVDKINYYENEQVINRVEGISHGLRDWGLTATLILAVVAILVTFNTIRLTIYNQKQEIEIMRLVGGSNWHIRMPYLVEGAIYGTIAAVIALVVFYPVVYGISPKLALLMPGVSLSSYFVSNSVYFALMLLVLGVFLGVASSLIAMRKFLKI